MLTLLVDPPFGTITAYAVVKVCYILQIWGVVLAGFTTSFVTKVRFFRPVESFCFEKPMQMPRRDQREGSQTAVVAPVSQKRIEVDVTWEEPMQVSFTPCAFNVVSMLHSACSMYWMHTSMLSLPKVCSCGIIFLTSASQLQCCMDLHPCGRPLSAMAGRAHARN